MCEGGALLNGIGNFIRRDMREMISLCPERAQQEGIHLQNGKMALPGSESAGTLTLGISASRTVRNTFLLVKPLNGIYATAAQTY